MFYRQYLSSLCQRRQWPEPHYQPASTRSGFKCIVRVNNREYHTDRTYSSEIQATENAAMRAYLICRNFSVNDGRYPTSAGRSMQEGILQGRPVAIGTERRSSHHYSGGDPFYDDGSSNSSGSRSGGSSPGSAEFPTSYRDENGRRRGMQGGTGHARVVTYGNGGSRRR